MSSIVQFFRDVRSELVKVVWPSRQETLRYTILVIVFSIVFAAVLGAFDYGLFRLFDTVINR
jgi:preprotein translocase subunit SecE